MYVINFIRGFLMAIADSVPGVSGGTIAFLLGFYDKFINSINDVISGSWEQRKEAIIFLAKVGIGWIVGIILSILVITSVFEDNIYLISSLFLGLIISAIPFIIKEEKDSIVNKYQNLVFTLLGIIIVFSITYFNPITSGSGTTGVSLESLNIMLVLFVILAGVIAISAMVLPGISGSTILLILGLYSAILNAIKELITFNFSYFLPVFFFGIGILIGVFSTVKAVRYVLNNYRSQTIYCIIGLMIGSLYAVVMGPKSLEVAQEPMSFSTFNILFFIIGIIIIFGLEQLKRIQK